MWSLPLFEFSYYYVTSVHCDFQYNLRMISCTFGRRDRFKRLLNQGYMWYMWH